MSRDVESATNAMTARWGALVHSMGPSNPSPSKLKREHGELTIIGSGIAHIDLTLNDEERVKSADRVFYCTNDRVTQTWIDQLRSDSLDLRILYGPDKDRFDTYVQMAEAMLHCTRQGERVLGIFYGHPGIFATPAHRAIRIARREGIRATMRPGISALDYLIADVGFDPMAPGLLSFDATDLVFRHRQIDPSLHVVLWQVGMVGEFKFDPSGFENIGFDRLVDELENAYAPGCEITHYIAPQYVGVEPCIEHYPLESLREENVRKRISWLSTFYIPPSPPRIADIERIGTKSPASDVERERDISAYGPSELRAVQALARFTAPLHYRAIPPSPAAKVMLQLSRDIEMREQYCADPSAFIARLDSSELTDRARQLLAIPHPLAFDAAFREPSLANEESA